MGATSLDTEVYVRASQDNYVVPLSSENSYLAILFAVRVTPDVPRVRARSDNEVVFELSLFDRLRAVSGVERLVAVVAEADPGADRSRDWKQAKDDNCVNCWNCWDRGCAQRAVC